MVFLEESVCLKFCHSETGSGMSSKGIWRASLRRARKLVLPTPMLPSIEMKQLGIWRVWDIYSRAAGWSELGIKGKCLNLEYLFVRVWDIEEKRRLVKRGDRGIFLLNFDLGLTQKLADWF